MIILHTEQNQATIIHQSDCTAVRVSSAAAGDPHRHVHPPSFVLVYRTPRQLNLALVDARERTTVGVDSAGYDERTSGYGCSPDGCIPENTRDNSRAANSRWSCKGDILDNDDGCWIEYSFEEPQDIVDIRIAFYRVRSNTRTLNVYDNGKYHSTITSSGGTTNGYQTFELDTDETSKLTLYLDDYESASDIWLSLTEVRLMVE